MLSIVRVAVGCVLLIPAALKFWALYSSNSTQLPTPVPTWLYILAAQVEVLMGSWFLLGWKPNEARIAGIALFVVFAGAATVLGVLGAETCGCLGHVTIGPWWMFGIDLTVICVLCFSKESAANARRVAACESRA